MAQATKLHRSQSQKAHIVTQSTRPGALVKDVARDHNVHPTLLSTWRTQARNDEIPVGPLILERLKGLDSRREAAIRAAKTRMLKALTAQNRIAAGNETADIARPDARNEATPTEATPTEQTRKAAAPSKTGMSRKTLSVAGPLSLPSGTIMIQAGKYRILGGIDTDPARMAAFVREIARIG